MVVLAWKHGSRLVQGHARGDLCLRIVGSQRDGQIVRLSGPKCTIGSAEGCTLRLRARGVRPLHCVILRGSRGTAARSWAANTRLNGRLFGDTLLVPGDRLTIGPIDFDVLDASVAEHLYSSQSVRTELIPRTPSESDSTSTVSAARRRAQVARDRVRSLIAALRTVRRDAAELRDQTSRQAVDDSSRQAIDRERVQREQEESARRAREELRSALDEFERERGAWAAENSLSHARMQDERTAIIDQREEAARLRQEFERERSELQAQFQTQVAKLVQEQEDWQAGRAADESRLAEERARLDAARIEMDGARAELDRRISQLEAATGKDGERLSAAARAEADVRAAVEKLERLRSELETRQSAAGGQLERQRSEFAAVESAHREAQEKLDAQARRLQAAEAELAGRQNEWGQARSTFEARVSEFGQHEARLAQTQSKDLAAQREREALLERREAQAQAAQEELAAERDAWHKRRAAEELEGRARIEQLDGQRDQLQQHQQRCEEQNSELARQQAALENQRDGLQQERKTLDFQLAEFTRQRADWEQAQAELSAETQAALFAERATLALIRQAWEADHIAAERNLARQTSELELREQHLSAQATALADDAVDRDTQVVLNRTLQANELDLESRQNQFEQDREAWNESRACCDARYARQLEQFEEQLTELRQREEALEGEHECLARTRQEQEHSAQVLRDLTAELEDRERKLAAREAEGVHDSRQAAESHRAIDAERLELDSVRQELEGERESLDEDRLQTAARLERERKELELLRVEIESRREDLQAEQVEFEGQRQALLSSPARANAESSEPSAGFDTTAGDADREIAADEAQEVEETAADVQDELKRRAAADGGSEEQSIEDYMAALLNRTRGGKPSEGVIAPQPKRNKRKSDAAPSEGRPKSAQKPGEVAPPAVVDLPIGTMELARRSAPAELADRAAMRELANRQTQIAIATHGNKRLFKKAARALGIGVGCAAATFLVLSVAPKGASILRTGAMGGLVVSVYLLFLGLTAAQELIVIRQRQRKGLRASLEESASRKS